MTEYRWDILANSIQNTNPGAHFQQAYQQGLQRKREMGRDKALQALAANPDDPNGFAELTRHDPQAAIQWRGQREAARAAEQRTAAQAIEANRDSILKGAQIIRQLQPKDQATWDAARQMAAQMGVDISQVPTAWDDNTARYVQGMVSLADALAPQRADNVPSFIREADMLGIPRERARELWETKQGTININGIPHVSVPSAGGGSTNLPTVSDEAGYNAIPAGGRYVTPDGQIRVKGGQSGASPASTGGFRP